MVIEMSKRYLSYEAAPPHKGLARLSTIQVSFCACTTSGIAAVAGTTFWFRSFGFTVDWTVGGALIFFAWITAAIGVFAAWKCARSQRGRSLSLWCNWFALIISIAAPNVFPSNGGIH
jgi:hypothetical protein